MIMRILEVVFNLFGKLLISTNKQVSRNAEIKEKTKRTIGTLYG